MCSPPIAHYALRFPFPAKYPDNACPVYDFFTRATCSGVP